MGPPLDHHRHIPRRPGARPHAAHGRPLSLLPARRQPRRAARKERKSSGKVQPDTPTHGDIRQGFVYERAPHITLKSIANNAEIDVIWEECAGDARTAARAAERGARQERGRNGRFRARPTRTGRRAAKGLTPHGGKRASRASATSTPPSPRKPTSNTSTTGPMRTNPASASPARSPSKACRRTASCPPTTTN